MSQMTIEIEGKDVVFKASAATKILYHQLFKTDITDDLRTFIDNQDMLKNMRAQVAAVHELPADNPQKVQVISQTIKSPAYKAANDFAAKFATQFAYITYLEGNKENPQAVFKELNNDAFLAWLMGYDAGTLGGHIADFMALWQSNEAASVKAKNANAR